MEPSILGLLNPKKNAALYHGLGPPIYEMDGPTEYQNQAGFLLTFPKWGVYEMTLGFPCHTVHRLFHSIGLQSRGIK